MKRIIFEIFFRIFSSLLNLNFGHKKQISIIKNFQGQTSSGPGWTTSGPLQGFQYCLTLDIQRVRGSREPKSKLSKYYTDVPDDLSYRFKICTICNSKIGRNNIIRHIQSVHKKYDEKDAKPQMCSFCGKEFLHTWERDRHVSNVHQAKLRRKKVEQGFQGAQKDE